MFTRGWLKYRVFNFKKRLMLKLRFLQGRGIRYSLIFDIGANIGKTAEFFSNCSNMVVCFEANPDLVSILRKKFKRTNVIVDDRGLSEKAGKMQFMISNSDTVSTFSRDWIENSRFAQSSSWERSVEVQTTTLDMVIDQYGVPDVVKIDVEGYEYEVLQGLTKLIKNTIFAFEWAEEQHEKIKKTLQYAHSLGYEKYGFTYGDEEDLLGEHLEWYSWNKLPLFNDIDPERKEKWGMIYFTS